MEDSSSKGISLPFQFIEMALANRQEFYRKIQKATRGTVDKKVDVEWLFDLYVKVMGRGGWLAMCGVSGWDELGQEYGGLPGDELREMYEEVLFYQEYGDNIVLGLLKEPQAFRVEKYDFELSQSVVACFAQSHVGVFRGLLRAVGVDFNENCEGLLKKLPRSLIWGGTEDLIRFQGKNGGGYGKCVDFIGKEQKNNAEFLGLSCLYAVMSGVLDIVVVDCERDEFDDARGFIEFLLENGETFYYIRGLPGDVIVINGDLKYYLFSKVACKMINWVLFDVRQIKEVGDFVIENRVNSLINLPLISLNIIRDPHTWSVQFYGVFCRIFKFFIEKGSAPELEGKSFITKQSEYHICILCGKSILWRYSSCECYSPQNICLTCYSLHECASKALYQQFSSETCTVLLSSLETRVTDLAELGFIEVLPENLGNGENVPVDFFEISKPKNQQNIGNMKKSAIRKEQSLQNLPSLDEISRNLPARKKLIRAALDHPLTGPRFTYKLPAKQHTFSPKLSLDFIYKNINSKPCSKIDSLIDPVLTKRLREQQETTSQLAPDYDFTLIPKKRK